MFTTNIHDGMHSSLESIVQVRRSPFMTDGSTVQVRGLESTCPIGEPSSLLLRTCPTVTPRPRCGGSFLSAAATCPGPLSGLAQ
jgi:hypothetical protein